MPARGENPRCEEEEDEEDEWLGERPVGTDFARLGNALTLKPSPSNKLCIPYTAVLLSWESSCILLLLPPLLRRTRVGGDGTGGCTRCCLFVGRAGEAAFTP